MAFAGLGFGALGSLALGASPSSSLKNGLIIGAANGLYQGHKKGRSFQWGGGMTRHIMKSPLRSPRRSHRRSPMQGGSRWVQNAESQISKRGHAGTFHRKAMQHGLTTTAFACKVLANKGLYDAKTVKQANFYRNINRSHRC